MTLENPGVQNGKYISDGISEINKREMFETFQSWALQNYGDSGKTKTVTRKKYNRIVRILTGEEECSTENSKFRFWVKAKGFRLGPKNGHHGGPNVLYVPVKQTVSHLLSHIKMTHAHSEDSGQPEQQPCQVRIHYVHAQLN